MKTTVKNRRSAEFWARHIKLAELDPNGIAGYCEARGLAIQTFYRWRLKLKSKPQPRLPALIANNPFVAVQVDQAKAAGNQPLPDAKWVAELILHLQGGVR